MGLRGTLDIMSGAAARTGRLMKKVEKINIKKIARYIP